MESNCTTRNYSFDGLEVIAAAVVVISLCLFALVANCLTFAVIVYSKHLRSSFYLLICSISISDFLSSVFSLLELYRRTWGFYEWSLSDPLCRTLWGVQFWTVAVTSFHIVSFSIIRYVVLRRMSIYGRMSTTIVKVLIASIWFVGILVGLIPGAAVTKVTRKPCSNETSQRILWPSCTFNTASKNFANVYIVFSYVVFIYVPIFLVGVCSVGMVCRIAELRKSRAKILSERQMSRCSATWRKERKEKQAMLQVGLISGSFLIGYLPFTVYHFYSVHYSAYHPEFGESPQSNNFTPSTDWLVGISAYFCLRISQCLNPIFYNIASSKMRRETRVMLKNCCRRSTED